MQNFSCVGNDPCMLLRMPRSASFRSLGCGAHACGEPPSDVWLSLRLRRPRVSRFLRGQQTVFPASNLAAAPNFRFRVRSVGSCLDIQNRPRHQRRCWKNRISGSEPLAPDSWLKSGGSSFALAMDGPQSTSSRESCPPDTQARSHLEERSTRRTIPPATRLQRLGPSGRTALETVHVFVGGGGWEASCGPDLHARASGRRRLKLRAVANFESAREDTF